MNPAITVMIPTTGRDSLRNTLESVVPQLQDGDRAIICLDGSHERIPYESEYRTHCFWLHIIPRKGRFGHPIRNRLLDKHVHTTHVWSIDDDDEAAPGALDAMRKHFDDPWTIFRMTYGDNSPHRGVTLPYDHRVKHGNLGTPMVFAPVTSARYGHHYSGDYDYASALREQRGEPVWADDIVAVIRP